jgi:hypothetical protein
MALGIVVMMFMPVLTIMLRRSGFDSLVVHLLTWVGYLGVGFLSFIFSYVVIRDLVWMSFAGFKMIQARLSKTSLTSAGSQQIDNPSRRGFLIRYCGSQTDAPSKARTDKNRPFTAGTGRFQNRPDHRPSRQPHFSTCFNGRNRDGCKHA